MAKTAAQAGKNPGYETTIITRNEMSEDALKKLQDRLASVVSSFKGEMVMTEDWGRKKMAYPIQKENRGHYTYYVYTGTGEIVKEIERNLRLNDNVLRFLTVNLEKEFDGESFKKNRAEFLARENEPSTDRTSGDY